MAAEAVDNLFAIVAATLILIAFAVSWWRREKERAYERGRRHERRID
jgi:Flp pilus assembly protein TadB